MTALSGSQQPKSTLWKLIDMRRLLKASRGGSRRACSVCIDDEENILISSIINIT